VIKFIFMDGDCLQSRTATCGTIFKGRERGNIGGGSSILSLPVEADDLVTGLATGLMVGRKGFGEPGTWRELDKLKRREYVHTGFRAGL